MSMFRRSWLLGAPLLNADASRATITVAVMTVELHI